MNLQLSFPEPPKPIFSLNFNHFLVAALFSMLYAFFWFTADYEYNQILTMLRDLHRRRQAKRNEAAAREKAAIRLRAARAAAEQAGKKIAVRATDSKEKVNKNKDVTTTTKRVVYAKCMVKCRAKAKLVDGVNQKTNAGSAEQCEPSIPVEEVSTIEVEVDRVKE